MSPKDIREAIKAVRSLGSFCAFTGRLNPMQLGHQSQVKILTASFPDRHLLALGSSNHNVSIRHLFSYHDRASFIRAIFPEARIVGLPDYESDEEWFHAYDDLIRAAGGDPNDTVFLGGSQEDVSFYLKTGRKTYIINRYAGLTKNVSGSEVRDALINKRSLRGMIDPRITKLVNERFAHRWNELRLK